MTASKFYSFQDSLLLVRFDEPAPIQSWSRENKGQYKIHKVHSHYYLMDHEGNIVSEEVLQLDFNYMVIENIAGIPPLPIHSQQLLTVSASDSIYTAYSKEFLLKVYGPDGSYKRSLYFPIEKMPVNLDNFINNYNDSQQIRNALRESELPEYWPILAGLLIDDQNRFWIPTYSKKKDALRWYLLGRKGEFFATFEWSADKYLHPIKLGIRTIRNGHLYAFVPINSDNPFEGKFVRFRIDLMPYGSINE